VVDTVDASSEGPSISPPPPGFKDRHTGLRIFGFMEVAFGLFCALAIPMMIYGWRRFVSEGQVDALTTLRTLVLACAVYGVASPTLVVLGVGAMRARRWAWALNLILSWVAVVTTVLVGGVGFSYRLWRGFDLQGVTAAVELAILAIGPFAFLLFYREKDVELTCKARDPKERWTDRRPLPVIAASCLTLWTAAGQLWGLVGGSAAVPSQLWHGGDGGVAIGIRFAMFVAAIYAAITMFKTKLSGWWVALVSEIVVAALALASPWQTVKLGAAEFVAGKVFGFPMVAVGIGFLVWARRYFPRRGMVAVRGSGS
jgi:hypothetical protein